MRERDVLSDRSSVATTSPLFDALTRTGAPA
jgi:hypothetical protein